MGKLPKRLWNFVSLFIFILFVTAYMSGCIEENLSYCSDEELQVYIKVTDAATGIDITQSGGIDDVDMYVFDNNGNFLDAYKIPASQIIRREPVVIKDYKLTNLMVSAWANLDNQVHITVPETGSKLENLAVSLLRDSGKNNYHISPNDFFFGFKEVEPITHATRIKEVVISQKNAKLYITVRGLDDIQADYYFEVLNNYTGYNYRGFPVRQKSIIKGEGGFNHMNEYISTSPYLLIHSAGSGEIGEEDSVWIKLYKKQQNENIKIVETNTDNKGNHITLNSGKTTNVLIDMDNKGELAIYIRVTPWDEIYQWTDY